MNSKHFFIFLMVLVVLLDVVTSYIGISSGMHELNPFINYQISKIGLLGTLLIKLVADAAGIFYLFKVYDKLKYAPHFSWFITGIQTFVSFSNAVLLLGGLRI